ncbi:hypothetical protein GR702_00400 [Novosphingobium sp. FGD1]|jgi:hypothetical protein|uniref:Uncharacterized protein n=1 Tax=Novosphingobium silvae TaxID=2692619 RepID=A0A7X4K6G7_9SPHN|nr:hypothetical protein [Novosphingobium silvae]MYL96233.1 hypothetical protein [Novosphingobium silvae]
MSSKIRHLAAGLASAYLALAAPVAAAQGVEAGPPPVTYADIADLADSAGLVVHAQVAKVVRIEDRRANGLTPGHGRFYIQARTRALLTGKAPLGESISYLVDLPLDARGKPPKLKKVDVFLFARAVPGRPGELQLVSPTAQQYWTVQGEARLRAILRGFVAPDAPAKITGVRELLYVPGNLAGQGETQIFLNTVDNSAASITVRHEPGAAPAWGVSFSELVADIGHPPQRDTIEWYRLACFLPNVPPARANVSDSFAAQQQALSDYRMVLGDLGPCDRTLK